MTRTSLLEVSIKTHIDCTLNISTIIPTVLCVYITAPPVNYSILCLSIIVHMVAFVNLLLKKMVVVVVNLLYFIYLYWRHDARKPDHEMRRLAE